MKIKFKEGFYYFTTVFVFFLMFFPYIVSAEERTLCPVGKTVGITVGIEGVSVVNVTEFESTNGEVSSPAAEAGMLPGDIILAIDGKAINSAADLEKFTDNSKGKCMTFEILRNDKTCEVNVSALECKADNKYRIGVWIKDSSSGIGTLTYYDKKTGEFGALGHGICDENNCLIDITYGNIHDTDVSSLRKGEAGIPGELIAIFEDDKNSIGEISVNSDAGIYGNLSNEYNFESPVGEIPIAKREEVTEGDVTILSNIEGKNVSEYSAKITKINNDKNDSKGMLIKITDDRLLDKTGGIIRGMSGSPIIQNGKFVGAVTHVLLNDPSRGYGIFIENMLTEAEKIK